MGSQILLEDDVPMNRTSFEIAKDEWSELRRSWYKSNNVEPDNYVLDESAFSALRMFDSKIGSKTLDEAEGLATR